MTTLEHNSFVPSRRRQRTLDVARMHSVAWPLAIAAPAAGLTIAFVIAFSIFALIPNPDSKTQFTGAVASVFFIGIGFYVQAMTQTFPFALGLSVTRREFYRATTATAVAQAGVFGAVVYLLSLVEGATDGFGVHMRMFGIFDAVTTNPAARLLALVSAFLLIYSTGIVIGVTFLRWKAMGLWSLFISAIAVFGGVSIVITWQKWWTNVGTALADTPDAVLLVIIPIAASLVMMAAGWIALRRATP